MIVNLSSIEKKGPDRTFVYFNSQSQHSVYNSTTRELRTLVNWSEYEKARIALTFASNIK